MINFITFLFIGLIILFLFRQFYATPSSSIEGFAPYYIPWWHQYNKVPEYYSPYQYPYGNTYWYWWPYFGRPFNRAYWKNYNVKLGIN